MDIDFWAPRVHSAKHFSALQASRLNSGTVYMSTGSEDYKVDFVVMMSASFGTEFVKDTHMLVDDSEGDDDTKACFPCPFCYVDIEVHLFCSHLQEEHCFDLINAVCPLCAANLGKDAMEHFMVQHANSIKRRKKFQKSGLLHGSSAMLGRELSSFLGSSVSGRGNAHDSVSDSLLSPFACNAPTTNNKVTEQDDFSNNASVTSKREPTLLNECQEEEIEERRQRATFIQQLIISTVF